MLMLVHERKAKRAAQSTLYENLTKSLTEKFKKNIGFPGGNMNNILHSAGIGKLWYAFDAPNPEAGVPRYWNAFGIYDSSKSSETIVVEINIPSDSNSGMVSGFFARDSESDDIFLMHDGGVGGGRKGIGKTAFLLWSKAKLVDVTCDNGKIRRGIAVAKLNDPDLPGRIWRFAEIVHSFKENAAAGNLETSEFKLLVEEFDRYRREFSGKKKGSSGGAFEYLTYHGDIVHKLFEERSSRARENEQILNSIHMDLFVRRDGHISEVYEVKTGAGRQALYTAIGQLMTHSAAGNRDVAKILVVPADEEIPDDIRHAIITLQIKVRRFRLVGSPSNRTISLVD